MRAGFSLVEVLVVVGLFGLILGIGVPIGIDSYRNYLLTSETRNMISILRRAQSLAFANDHQSAHGVVIETSRFLLFQGSSFASRDTDFDEEYLKAASVTASGTTEIVFSPVSGLPNATATIVLDNILRSQTININDQGTIFW